MVSTLRADAQRNYEQILQAAEQLLKEVGSAVTFERIAEKAHVGIGTLYRHFPTRLSLFQATYETKTRQVAAKATTLLTTAAPDRALRAWLGMVVEYSARYSGFNNLVELAVTDQASPIAQAGENLVKAAQKARLIRSDVAVADILKLINGLLTGTSEADIKQAEKLIEIVVDGLKAD